MSGHLRCIGDFQRRDAVDIAGQVVEILLVLALIGWAARLRSDAAAPNADAGLPEDGAPVLAIEGDAAGSARG